MHHAKYVKHNFLVDYVKQVTCNSEVDQSTLDAEINAVVTKKYI